MKRYFFILALLQGTLFSLDIGEQVIYDKGEQVSKTEEFGKPHYYGDCGEYFPVEGGVSGDEYTNRHDFWTCVGSPMEVIPEQTFSSSGSATEFCSKMRGDGIWFSYEGKCVDGYDEGSISRLSDVPQSKIAEMGSIVYEQDPTKKFIRSFYDLDMSNVNVTMADIPLFDNMFRLDLDYTVTAPMNKPQYFVLSSVFTNSIYDIDRYDATKNYVLPVMVSPNSQEGSVIDQGNLVCGNSAGPEMIPEGVVVTSDRGESLVVDSSNPRWGCQKTNMVYRPPYPVYNTEPTIRSLVKKRSEPKRNIVATPVCSEGWDYVNGICIEKDKQYTLEACKEGMEYKELGTEQLCINCEVMQFPNNDFDNGLEGWNTVTSQVHLNGNFSIGGFSSSDDTTYYNNVPNEDYAQSDGAAPIGSITSIANYYGRSIVQLDTTNFWITQGCGIYRNTAIYSQDPVFLIEGSTVSVTWRSVGNGDAYDSYAYLVNVRTGQKIILIDATGTAAGQATPWYTTSVEVGAGKDGLYKFVFVGGTYDATCGRLVGGALQLDKVNVSFNETPPATTTEFQSITSNEEGSGAAASESFVDTSSVEGGGGVAVESELTKYENSEIELTKSAELTGVPAASATSIEPMAGDYIYDTPIWHPNKGCVNVREKTWDNWEYVRDTSYEDPAYCPDGELDETGMCVRGSDFKAEITVNANMGGVSKLCWDDYLSVSITGIFGDGSNQSRTLEFFNSRKNWFFDNIFAVGDIVYSKNSPTTTGIGVLEAGAAQIVINSAQSFKNCLYSASNPSINILKYINMGYPFIKENSYKVSYLHRNIEGDKKSGVVSITLNTDNTDGAFQDKKDSVEYRFTNRCEDGYYEDAQGECILDLFTSLEYRCILDKDFYLPSIETYTEYTKIISNTLEGKLGEGSVVTIDGVIYSYKAVPPFTSNGTTYDFIWTDNPYDDGRAYANNWFPN